MALPKQGARVTFTGVVVGVNDHTNPALHHVRIQLKDGQMVVTNPGNVTVIETEAATENAALASPPETVALSGPPETTAIRGPRETKSRRK